MLKLINMFQVIRDKLIHVYPLFCCTTPFHSFKRADKKILNNIPYVFISSFMEPTDKLNSHPNFLYLSLGE